MTFADYVTYGLLAVLVVRSVMQQIYIRRLKGAMLNMCEAMERSTGLRIKSKLRGQDIKILP